ncbi:MAG: hypothetical protein IKV59_04630 [Lachnospiraceae bacterium]|nr:hypothetical protein [Lachnospiraceae bacterium]
MTYEYFLLRLEERILDCLKEKESVRRVQVLKNNGVKLDGFCYRIEGHREQPTVYVNHYYKEEISDRNIKEIAALVLKVQRESSLKRENELVQVLDFEKMKNHIFYRLISREKNTELLKDVPWLPFLDLALVFYLRIPEHIIDHATALIHTSHMERWGISRKRLYQTAAENMARTSIYLEAMEAFLEEYGLEVQESGMYVLSCGDKEYGAAVIVNSDVMKECGRRLGEDYYVLPSSIHEVILLPESLATSEKDLDELVQEVNETCVSQEDYLSDHAYRYCVKTGRLS